MFLKVSLTVVWLDLDVEAVGEHLLPIHAVHEADQKDVHHQG